MSNEADRFVAVLAEHVGRKWNKADLDVCCPGHNLMFAKGTPAYIPYISWY
jgi:hypothetical protein